MVIKWKEFSVVVTFAELSMLVLVITNNKVDLILLHGPVQLSLFAVEESRESLITFLT